MDDKDTPKVDKTYYEEGIKILEAEIANLESTKTLDERLRLRLEAALEDLKAKLEASN
jgi:hypothetical protein